MKDHSSSSPLSEIFAFIFQSKWTFYQGPHHFQDHSSLTVRVVLKEGPPSIPLKSQTVLIVILRTPTTLGLQDQWQCYRRRLELIFAAVCRRWILLEFLLAKRLLKHFTSQGAVVLEITGSLSFVTVVGNDDHQFLTGKRWGRFCALKEPAFSKHLWSNRKR